MRVIGTAGHVDHGKSTLIEALTGTHPDRLKEEREREMTIDLGFAWLELPGGEEIGIVDVPGHRDFIENMLAGVGGVDAVLFVIAADEGIMPQTREHLSILNLLQVQGGVIALTKTDLVDDLEWLYMVEDDIQQIMKGTVLDGARIVPVSARTKQGLQDLLIALRDCLEDKQPRLDIGKPRLPVDRVFTIAGFGTVVTGTLSDGNFNVGDEVEILPAGQKGRIRGLQTHKKKEQQAVPGSRTAMNISGVAIDQVKRGHVIIHPGDYNTTRRLDVRFQLLPDVSQPLKHNTMVKLYLGTAEIVSRLRLLGVEELVPGSVGWLQLELESPVTTLRGDRYIIRRPSPGETLGGGEVVDPFPKRRHKRFSQEVLDRLESLAQGTPVEILTQSLLSLGFGSLREVYTRSELDTTLAQQAAQELADQGILIQLDAGERAQRELTPDSLVAAKSTWMAICVKAVNELERFHQEYPLRRGMPREELKSRLKLTPRLFNPLIRWLVNQGQVTETGPLIIKPGHTIQLNPTQQERVRQLFKRIADAPNAPPSVKDCQGDVGEDVYAALLDLGELVQVSGEVVFAKKDYDRLVAGVRQLIIDHGEISAAQVRDHFNTSRKYVLALLEHLDASGVTVRQGDVRRLKG